MGFTLDITLSLELSVLVPVGLSARPGGLDPDLGLKFFILKEDT